MLRKEAALELTLALLGILGALLVGAISPGPSFVVVAQTAISRSRADGLAAALGMGLGGVAFGALALLGLQTLLAQAPWLYLVLKLLGGAYLLYIAVRLWRAAADPLAVPEPPRAGASALRGSFLLGLATQISNPKTAVVYASVFAAFLPASMPAWVLMLLPALIFAVEAGWYALVALVFSASGPRAVYLRSKLLADRLAGAVMGLLGLKLMIEAARGRVA
jgi:threonine/homoserine/homoserine lactone efflux protein